MMESKKLLEALRKQTTVALNVRRTTDELIKVSTCGAVRGAKVAGSIERISWAPGTAAESRGSGEAGAAVKEALRARLFSAGKGLGARAGRSHFLTSARRVRTT